MALERAGWVVEGMHQAYRSTLIPLPADAAAWTRHPRTGRTWMPDAEWWKVPHIRPEWGDIKDLWEPARFAWVYDLVRGFAVEPDPAFPEAFVRRFDAWLASSPPFRGPHWSCGQEAAIRSTALLYAEANLPLPEPARAALTRTLAASGERIADGFDYARSQRNNHGISEAASLIALGTRFLGSHPRASAWLRLGHRAIERMLRDQFEDDGWYIQHSFTYLRLALDQAVIAERALRSTGRALSSGAVGRIRAATDLLLAVLEPTTGIVPNHGPNDGAFVHPITLADYRDFRAVLTAAAATFGFTLPADVQPDPEVAAWLALDPPEASAPLGARHARAGAGWAAARRGDVAVFVRAGRYRSRPGHVDPLHIDVRVNGSEFIVDPGTFAYIDDDGWRNDLAGADAHNGPLLDDMEPAVRGPRFLWLTWPSARFTVLDLEEDSVTMVARAAYGVERTVRVDRDGVVVEDRAIRPAGAMRVRWLLSPAANRTLLVTSAVDEGTTAGAGEDLPAGWFSPFYKVRVPAPALQVAAFGERAMIRTVITAPRRGGE